MLCRVAIRSTPVYRCGQKAVVVEIINVSRHANVYVMVALCVWYVDRMPVHWYMCIISVPFTTCSGKSMVGGSDESNGYTLKLYHIFFDTIEHSIQFPNRVLICVKLTRSFVYNTTFSQYMRFAKL